jgi:hypothetical protein
MKKIFTKRWLIAGAAVALFAGALMAFPSSNTYTDFWTIFGVGSLRNTAIAFIDSNRDFNLYDGDFNLGVSQSRPTTATGTYPGITVPIYNASGSAWTEGDVIIASATASTAGYGSYAAINATTTVIGVAAESIANGAVGLMKVSGWALVKTTGTVQIGNILVSTSGSNGAGVAGYAGVTTGTQVVGTAIGKAMSVGTAGGGTTLVLLNGK